MEDDLRRETDMAAFDAAVEFVRQFLRERATEVQAQLDGPLPELCENALDDDGDDHTDCDDRGCALAGACYGRSFSCLPTPHRSRSQGTIALTGGVYIGISHGSRPT